MKTYTLKYEGYFRSGSSVVKAKSRAAAISKLRRWLTKKFASKVWKISVVRENPATTSGYVKCKAVKIVRNKAGKAVSVKIKT